ncbi:hypothetical protein VLK31_10595 [Variovorax sp. H27-G14]|uniref:hypothetical protein n=1 Tax=Variovorax sp. H27-G14 TaxID=3111914 RepID=UPI0038FCBA97
MTDRQYRHRRGHGIENTESVSAWGNVVAARGRAARTADPFYGGKRIAHSGSLGTSDPQEARVRAAAKRAELEAQFLRQCRELAPPKLAAIAPEVRRCIVEALLHADITEDAAQRMNKGRSSRVYGPVIVAYELADGALPERPTTPPVSPLAPLAPEVVAARAAFNKRRRETVRAALVSGNLEVMIPIVQPIVRRLGLAIDYMTPDGAQLLQECLAAYSSTRDTAVHRDEGQVVQTPPAPVLPAEVKQHAQELQALPKAPPTAQGH